MSVIRECFYGVWFGVMGIHTRRYECWFSDGTFRTVLVSGAGKLQNGGMSAVLGARPDGQTFAVAPTLAARSVVSGISYIDMY